MFVVRNKLSCPNYIDFVLYKSDHNNNNNKR